MSGTTIIAQIFIPLSICCQDYRLAEAKLEQRMVLLEQILMLLEQRLMLLEQRLVF